MVSRVRSTFVMGLLLALIFSITSIGVVVTPAQAATDSTVATISSSSPTMNRLAATSCIQSATTAHYTVVKYTTNSVGSMSMGLTVKTSGPVTAMLYQGVFLPEQPYVNCYIAAWNQGAGQVHVEKTGYNNSELPQFPDQTWYLVLASDNPGSGVSAEVSVTTSIGTVAVDKTPVVSDPTITTNTLPQGIFGAAYTTTAVANGGTAPYTFTATGLPAGLRMSSAGVISGIPTATGTFDATVTVIDAQGRTTGKILSLVVPVPDITVGPDTLTNATVGNDYAQTLSASGSTGPYTYALWVGALPAGLSVSSAGILAGTPTSGGAFSLTIIATDISGARATRTYLLTVDNPTIVIDPPEMPPLDALDPAEVSITANGATAPYSYSVSSGTLPKGLSLSSSGVLTGTPSVTGPYSFTVTAVDSSTGNGPFQGHKEYTGTIAAPQLPVINPGTLPNGAAGQAYSQQLSGANGVEPYLFSVSAGSLPAGITMTASGLISGTPTASGTFSFSLTATDSRGRENTTPYTLVMAKPTITVGPTLLPQFTAYDEYSVNLTASSGVGPYEFAVTHGVLPDGISLAANGTLSGTPTLAGTSSFTVTATDSSTGTGPASGARDYLLNVAAPVMPSITPGTVPKATAGVAYSQQLTGATGVAPYAFSIVSGALPAGVTLSPTGLLSGTPTVAGSFPVGIKVIDARALPTTSDYTLTIATPTISITPETLLDGQVGAAYSADLTASDGTGPYTFAVSAGELPEGLTLTAAGKLSGTPTVPGPTNFIVTATDKLGFPATRDYSHFSKPAPLAVGPESLPAPTAGDVYSTQLSTAGGYGTFSYSISSGKLPTGLDLNVATGVISGIPTVVGSYTFSVTSIDSATTANPVPTSVRRSYTLVVPASTLKLSGTLPQARAGSEYLGAVAAAGGTGPYTFVVSAEGVLPLGLTLAADGLLTGTPTTAGTYSVGVTVTDVFGSTTFLAAVLTVAPNIVVGPETLTNAQVGRSYEQQLTANGGAAPHAFTVTAGQLPHGLVLGLDGKVSGAPSVHGTASFEVTAKDANGFTGIHQYTLDTDPAPLAVNPEPLAQPTAGSEYSVYLSVRGGIGPFNFAVTSGAMPVGLTLDGDAGKITGIPTSVGSYAFTITATDMGTGDEAVMDTQEFVFDVPSASLVLTANPSGGQVGEDYSVQLLASGGHGPYGFILRPATLRVTAATAGLPAGLSLSDSGFLSGVPTQSGDFKVALVITDAYGSSSQATAALTIAEAKPTVEPTTPPAVLPTVEPSTPPAVGPTVPATAPVEPTAPAAAATPTATGPAGAEPTPSALSATGASGTLWLTIMGGAVLMAGIAAMSIARRKRQH